MFARMGGQRRGKIMSSEDGMGIKMSPCRDWVIRCPRLGGEVPFSYCEREAGDLPCAQISHCWADGFAVEEYLRETLTPDAWERFRARVPKDRLSAILDVVKAAGQRKR